MCTCAYLRDLIISDGPPGCPSPPYGGPEYGGGQACEILLATPDLQPFRTQSRSRFGHAIKWTD